MNTLLTDVSILWPALIAGVLVAISHVPLGQQVLSRGIVFIDLAIAQVAGLGVIAANCFELPIEGQPTRTLKPGDGFQIPLATPHAGGKAGTAKTRVLITYVVEKGKPLASPA